MGDIRLSTPTSACLVLLAAVAREVFATGLGRCPIYPQLPNFDITRMTGTWYEVERSFYLMEMSASCTQLDVGINERGHLLITINTINRWTGAPATTYGLGILSHTGASSFRYRLNNRMPYLIGRLLPGAGQYNILATDYDQFALVWSCTSLSIAHSDRMWVFGRRREIDAHVRAQIYAVLQDLDLDPDRLILSKNNNCTEAYNNTIL
ncbi:unnamed protein product, partial [Iphiclides podalirius]